MKYLCFYLNYWSKQKSLIGCRDDNLLFLYLSSIRKGRFSPHIYKGHGKTAVLLVPFKMYNVL